MRRRTVIMSLAGVSLFVLLALAVAATDSTSTEVNSWQQNSQQGNFLVDLRSPAADIGLSEFHTWQLSIRDAKTKLGIVPARVVVGGGMPAHGHGLPTQPQVTAHLGDGNYQLEGLMFNMAGQWQLVFDISTRTSADRVIFDLVVEH